MRPKLTLAAAALVAVATALALSIPPRRASPGSARSVVVEGVRFDFELRPIDGDSLRPGHEAEATILIRDDRSGEPVRGATVRAWLTHTDGRRGKEACRDRIRKLAGGKLAARAEIDLNQSWLLALNADNTLSVIDPLLAFDRTKLRALVTLPGHGADWTLHPDRRALYVSVPAADRIAVVDTSRFVAKGSIAVGSSPRRLALSPDGRRLWVSNSGDETVTVIDHESREPLATLKAGPGEKRISFGRQGRIAWVAADDALLGFDALTLEALARIDVGPGPYLLATDTRGASHWIVRQQGELLRLDEKERAIETRLPILHGASEFALDPGGRWAFILFAEQGRAIVVDASSGEHRASLEGLDTPDAVTFTERYAYVRSGGSNGWTLVDLQALRRGGDPVLVDVTISQLPPGVRDLASPAVPTATGDGIIVASPKDRALLFYAEGMMAPMGSLQNYGREPRAAMLLDRSLREVAPGVHRTRVRLPSDGTLDLSLILSDPRLGACLDEAVEIPAAEEPPPPLRLEPLFDPATPLVAGTEQRLRFRAGEALRAEELEMVAFRPPGTWQWRGPPVALDERTFEIRLRPPEGRIRLVAAAPTKGAPFGSLPPIDLSVRAASSKKRR